MPAKNGFDLLKEIESIDFEFIFTNAYPEHAIKALQAEALDYLIKPVNTNDLILAIERFEIKLSKKLIFNNYIKPKSNLMPNGNKVLKKNSITNK